MPAETEVRDGLVDMINQRISTLPRHLVLDDDHEFRIKFRADEIYRELTLGTALRELLRAEQEIALAETAEALSATTSLARLRARYPSSQKV